MNNMGSSIGYVALRRLEQQNPNSTTYIIPEKVLQINNQSELIDITKNAMNPLSRREAVKKISDEDVLIDIAHNDPDSWHVRKAAVEKINNEDILIDIARNDSDDLRVRKAAVEKISDEDVLIDISCSDAYVIHYPGGFDPAKDGGPEPPHNEYPLRKVAKNRLKIIKGTK